MKITPRRQSGRIALLAALLLLFLLTGQAAAALHHHGELASRRNCPVCVQSAHDSAVPEAGIRIVFHARRTAALPEPTNDLRANSMAALPDARSPPSAPTSV